MEMLKVPKWKRIPLPEDIFSMKFSSYDVVSDIPEHMTVEDVFEERLPITKGFGTSFGSYNDHDTAKNITIKVERSFEQEVATFMVNVEDGDFLENIHIEANSGANGMLIFEYTQKADVQSTHHQWLQVKAAPGAKLDIYVIQRLNGQSRHFSQQVSYVEENADVKITTFELGCALQVLSVEQHLLGRHSNGDIRLGYLVTGNQKSDYENSIYHEDAQTTSTILAKGVLRDAAKKVYRGNLVFENGSPQSEGREEEFAILLNEGVRSDSIPALLCKEDDVIGEHACSAGQIDQEQLFYVMSRGYSKAEAELLLVQSSFTEMMEALPEEKQAILQEWIARRIHGESPISNIQ